jgi:hypothetical protein
VDHDYGLYLLVYDARMLLLPSHQVCRERVSSVFLPSGPRHMLPPAALHALTLSDQRGAANEVLTVAVTVDPETGR